ncbi:MAG: hypothetical protein KF681_08205 [Bdellovibrionaceae bacterium]|nr:hypothetical protein [Pseudobdellovibrionaceae bacterium]
MNRVEYQKSAIEKFISILESRFSSPFFGPLILSWSILNWRIPIYLVFGGDASRATYIAEYLHAASALDTVIWPALIGGAYCFGGPIVSAMYDRFLAKLAQREVRIRIKEDQDLEYYRIYNTVPGEFFEALRKHAKNLAEMGGNLSAALKMPDLSNDRNVFASVVKQTVDLVEKVRDMDKLLEPFPDLSIAQPSEVIERHSKSKKIYKKKVFGEGA